MTPPPYRIRLSPSAQETRDGLEQRDARKLKRVNKALKLLAANPRHPSLNAHKFDDMNGFGPDNEDIWEAYVENNTPGAWRIFFYYEKNSHDVIAVADIGPHP